MTAYNPLNFCFEAFRGFHGLIGGWGGLAPPSIPLYFAHCRQPPWFMGRQAGRQALQAAFTVTSPPTLNTARETM